MSKMLRFSVGTVFSCGCDGKMVKSGVITTDKDGEPTIKPMEYNNAGPVVEVSMRLPDWFVRHAGNEVIGAAIIAAGMVDPEQVRPECPRCGTPERHALFVVPLDDDDAPVGFFDPDKVMLLAMTAMLGVRKFAMNAGEDVPKLPIDSFLSESKGGES